MTFALAQALRGNLAVSRGDVVEALRIDQAALDVLGDGDGELAARVVLCPAPIFAVLNGDISTAVALADRLLHDARRLGQPSALAMALYSKGFVMIYGEVDPATGLEALRESVALTRAGASDAVFAQALMTIAHQLIATDNAAEALPLLREAVAHSNDAGDMISAMGATLEATLAFAGLGLDIAGATCAGTLVSGVFASSVGSFAETSKATFAAMRQRLGNERYDAAFAHGAVANYADVVAFVIATFDEALASPH
jgi:hypothetical protein